MVAQNGQDLLIKADLTGSKDFKAVAGIRSNKISFNAQTVNVTHAGSIGQWRELLTGGGVKSANISGNGVFVDEDCDGLFRSKFFDGEHVSLQFILPDFGVVEGLFQITTLEYSGNYDGEMLFDMGFASAGALTFKAETGTSVP